MPYVCLIGTQHWQIQQAVLELLGYMGIQQVHIRSTLKVSKDIFDDIPIEECWRKNVSRQEIHSKWDVHEQQRKQCAEQKELFRQQEFVVLQKQVDKSSGWKRKWWKIQKCSHNHLVIKSQATKHISNQVRIGDKFVDRR